MRTITQPSKEQVRTWLQERQVRPTPLPDTAAIRRALGWGLVPHTQDRRSF